jgi:2-polyprenyl-6-methoxyphenol hydroxylase-like FAD-dependent oxidoreductase
MFGRKKPEVLVVGAGPVGLFTALALAERGVQVQVMDREWRTGTRSYACGVHAESLRLLEELGVLTPLLEGARRIRQVGLYDERERRAAMRIADLAEDHSFLAVLRQEDLERILVQALEKRGVKIIWNHQIARIAQLPEHVDVTVEKLSKDTMGYAVQHTEWMIAKTKHLEVPFVIGADGHHSAVRRALDIEYPEVAPATEFAVFEFKTDADLGDEMRLVLGEDSTNLCWPLPNGHCRWSFQQTAGEVGMETRDKDRDMVQLGSAMYPQLTEEHLRELLAARAPWFEGSIEAMRWRMVVRFENRLTESLGGGRAWILGDAAHLTGPAGIQSMNVGFKEGKVLATLISAGADPSAMRRFDQDRKAEWKALLGLDKVVRTRPDTDPWIAARGARLLPCIPASGADLARLAAQVGLDIAMP